MRMAAVLMHLLVGVFAFVYMGRELHEGKGHVRHRTDETSCNRCQLLEQTHSG